MGSYTHNLGAFQNTFPMFLWSVPWVIPQMDYISVNNMVVHACGVQVKSFLCVNQPDFQVWASIVHQICADPIYISLYESGLHGNIEY